jgi:hypothetical protein
MLASIAAFMGNSNSADMPSPNTPPASPSSTIDLTYSPPGEGKMLSHVRANLKHGFVSAADALAYIRPGMQAEDVMTAVNRLPRAAYIMAYWPPDKKNEKDPACMFKAVKLENIKLLLDGDDKHALEAIADDFIADMQSVAVRGSDPVDFDDRYKPMILANDAAKTQGQKRYERDVTDRLLHSEKYYSLKRKRDSAFRARKKQEKPSLSPVPEELSTCSECDLPCDKHFVHCSKNSTFPGLEK